MRIAAIDTAERVGRLGLFEARADVPEGQWRSEVYSAPMNARHGEILLPTLRELLTRFQWSVSDLDLLVVALGPGSFTGLRVGLSTAKGLAFASNIPIVGVGSLELLAASAPAPAAPLTAVAAEAYRGEVYGGLFSTKLGADPARVFPDSVGSAERFRAAVAEHAGGAAVRWVGDGVESHAEALAVDATAANKVAPSSLKLAALGLRRLHSDGPADLASLAPLYLRGADAKLPKVPLTL